MVNRANTGVGGRLVLGGWGLTTRRLGRRRRVESARVWPRGVPKMKERRVWQFARALRRSHARFARFPKFSKCAFRGMSIAVRSFKGARALARWYAPFSLARTKRGSGGRVAATVHPRIILAHTYYPEFLKDFYATEPSLEDLGYDRQLQRLLRARFSVSDAYSEGLHAAGWEAHNLVINADAIQRRWAGDHDLNLCGNVHDQRRQILAAQVEAIQPDVLYVFEWSPLGDAFLADIKRHVRLVVGQIASPLRDDRTYQAYDLMISSWPPIVEYFRDEGGDAEMLKLGFDARILDHLEHTQPEYDVTFVGGFAPSHPDRVRWLERLLAEVNVHVFGYGIENAPEGSNVRAHHHGPAWGRAMYQLLQRSRITLNRHARIDVRGRVATNVANNMRLYEATGVGSCLLTDAKENLAELFEPGQEVATYSDERECVDQICHLLGDDNERRAIANAGQNRTLRDHTYASRMCELSEMLLRRL